MSVAECAAVQSFPADVEFAGSARSQYQQIGNAVPPLLGRAVGRQLAKHLEGVPSRTPPEPDWRKRSANRRIGTHGWVVVTRGRKPLLTVNVKVRQDHVWADMGKESDFDFDQWAV